ncbi:protein rep, partial [Escherichia coli]|uniref:protein rep n=1 Tax=Escherichia coli TaxID=562 RepID=UPI000AA8E027
MLNRMNAAFQRLKDRKEFRPVQGWIRTTEVTRSSDGSAHPHFHTLMMVPPSMLSGDGYVKHARWVELWRECLRVSYDPNVDVRAVKPRKPKDGESLAGATAELVRGAVAETLKYSTKPAGTGRNGLATSRSASTGRQDSAGHGRNAPHAASDAFLRFP